MNWLIGIALGVVTLFGVTALTGAPYVPTRRREICAAFDELYAVSDTDTIIDIGCGDGVVLREAARRGARAVGYEINPLLVLVAKMLSHRVGRVDVRLQNFWRAEFPADTTLVYTFGDGRDIEKMATKVAEQSTRLGKPLYFMSYGFELKKRVPLRSHRAHFLYKIEPHKARTLQIKKP